MSILDIIDKKRNKLELSKEEIEYVISAYLKKEIKDYQMSSLLMAITINGMNESETIYLTDAFINSGDKLDLSLITKKTVDKHSTGGVGDKTTLIVSPIVASIGLAVPKMSGRGLGHTGGTIDKLESITGFQVELTKEQFIKQVNDIGIAIIGQQNNLVLADKELYALRDVTGTVLSIPLIASSIMSKKIASGADVIVLDIKVGNGALFSNLKEAKKLAKLMVKIGKKYNKKTICVFTNMNQPLGKYIGNGLEVIESLNFLKGEWEPDLYEVTTTVAAYMISAGKNITFKSAYELVLEKLETKEAYYKFLEFVKAQKGDINNIKISEKTQIITSKKSGYIISIDTLILGNLVKKLGGGRQNKEDSIDLGVGFILNKKIGDFVSIGDELLKVFYNKKDLTINEILDCFEIDSLPLEPEKIIYDVIK